MNLNREVYYYIF